jgi:magnesium transporter
MKKKVKLKLKPFRKKQHSLKKIGLPPGELIYTGEQKEEAGITSFFTYNEDSYTEVENIDFNDVITKINPNSTNWINVIGLQNTDLINSIGNSFSLNVLTLEDILNIHHLPKFEIFDSYVFFVLKSLKWDYENAEIDEEQISLVLGKNYLITFQERVGDSFENIRDRIRNAKGRVRKKQADYLFYILIDSIVDGYYLILEEINNQISQLESDLLSNPNKEMPQRISFLKGQLVMFRKNTSPVSDAIRKILKADSKLIEEQSLSFFSDINDHLQHINQNIEIHRETLNSFMEYHLSYMNNTMSEVMKTLTIITTIFIPLSFIAGVYGMNFQHMPELAHPMAYPAVLGFMALVMIIMFLYMRSKKWF